MFANRNAFTRSEAPVHFVPKVFNKILVGELWTQWQYCDCVIIEPFDYRHFGMLWLLSCWNTHSSTSILNFTIDMLMISCKMF